MYAGGLFTRAAGVKVNYIARWNGSGWFPLGTGMDNPVVALAVIGTDLYAGGVFDSAGGVKVNYVAKWDGSSWSALGTGLDNQVDAIASYGTDLYAGGFFENAGGGPASHIARWDGFGWSSLGIGLRGTNYVQTLLATSNGIGGTNVYVGGQFDTAGGVAARYIAEWNGGHWSALGTGTNWNVLALAVSGTDIYAGGLFNFAGGVLSPHVARWDGSTWSAVGSGVGDYSVLAIAVYGTDLYASGTFTAFSNSDPHDIARWNGSSWSPLGSGTGPRAGYGTPEALVISGNDLYVGGYLRSAGGKPSMYFARWGLPPRPSSVSIVHRSGWNLVSTPEVPSNDSVKVLFPDAVSKAFSYTSGGYQISSTMTPGVGYWLKFPTSTGDSITGTVFPKDSVPVIQGWNLIGSISQPIYVGSITSNPPGMITSRLFGYSGSYVIADSIRPGSAYWVKTNQAGKLFLASSGLMSASNRIKITPTPELPPAPPNEKAAGGRDIPIAFSLDHNYPNPFNPTTVLRYALPTASRVRLSIYNVLGQLVTTLVDRDEDAGYKQIRWSASAATSGVYFYRLQAGKFSDVKKMMLVK